MDNEIAKRDRQSEQLKPVSIVKSQSETSFWSPTPFRLRSHCPNRRVIRSDLKNVM